MKIKAILIAISMFILSCDEQNTLPSNDKVILKTKRFRATNMKQIFNKPGNIENSTTQAYLGSTTIDGLKVYARPFFALNISSTKYEKVNGELLFKDSKFKISVKKDSAGTDVWNKNFTSNVKLKMSAIEFSGDTLFTKNSPWDGYRFQPIPNLKNPYKNYKYEEDMVFELGENEIKSGEMLEDTTITFDISQDKMNNVYNKYHFTYDNVTDVVEDTMLKNFAGFFLDLEDYSGDKGMVSFSFDSKPTLHLNYVDTDSVATGVIDVDDIEISSSFTWFTYEQIASDGSVYLKSGDRSALLLDFEGLSSDSLNQFLRTDRVNKRIYGGQLHFKNKNTSDQSVSNLRFASYADITESTNTLYLDDYPTYSSYGQIIANDLEATKDSLTTATEFKYAQDVNFDSRHLTFWIDGSREFGKFVIYSKYDNNPGFSKFYPNDLTDFYIDIYYESKEEGK